MTTETLNRTIYRDGARHENGEILSHGHHHENSCDYCSHGVDDDATGCWCPWCVDPQEVGNAYPCHVEYHGMAPPHANGLLESMCDFAHQH